ncbi:MAG: 5'/3'-nucleotidase SurE [Bacteroidetes bacterium]|nr:5'/3'-nucleotidase SurE [Bacteroidota bacterium]
MAKPLILVCNDDGISAPGISSLVKSMRQIGDVVVVAPDSPQSGTGHAITMNHPLRMERVHLFDEITAYQCSGTPVDCVKLAVDKVLHRHPDLLVSGINHGSNSSINVIYSGTISAAVEGAIEGINSIGFSLNDYGYEADFEASVHYSKIIAEKVLQYGLPQGTLLNVNIPKLKTEEIKGIKICRQAKAKWVEEFDERTDPHRRKYYWLTGNFVNNDHGEDTDEWALKNGFISIVPTQFDLTAHHSISILNTWNFQ